MPDNGDNHIPSPTGKWTFDASVTEHFDVMLQNSIPSYDTMRSLTFQLGKHFVQPGTNVIDVGSSRGAALQPFVDMDSLGQVRPNLYALEISEPMLEVLRDRFKNKAHVHVMPYDLRKIDSLTPFQPQSASVVLSILTILFTPLDYRLKILNAIYDSLRPGGAFLFVEKVLGNSHAINEVMIEQYYELKAANGYSYEDIQRKRASLEGVQVMMTADWTENMLKSVGFKQVDVFYRHLNFCGWIAVK